MLQVAAQGSCTVLRIVGGVDDEVLGLLGQLTVQLLLRQTPVEGGKLQVDDADDVVLGQRLIEDDLVETVEEFRAERALEKLLHLLLSIKADAAVGVNALQQRLRAQVGGQDQDGVLEIHRSALRVGDAAVVEHLQKHVEHVGMGLFHLVKEDHAVGLAAHGLGELAALVVAHIAGRRSDQTGDGKFLHIFRHINAHEVLFVIEQRFGQGLGQLGLADAGGSQEQEAAQRTVGILDAGAAAENGLRNGLDRLILADDALVQLVLQVQELIPLPLHQLGHGDAGPALDDLGDLLLRHLVPQEVALPCGTGQGLLMLQLLFQLRQLAVLQPRRRLQVVALLGLFDLGADALDALTKLLDLADAVFLVLPLGFHGVELLPLLGKLLPQLLQTALGEGVGLVFQRRLLDLHLDDLPADHVQLRGHGVHLRADHGAGLVNEVDGLVRQEAVGDIAVGQGRGGDDGRVCDLDAVEDLVALLQAAQNRNRVLHRRLRDQNGLEAALQSRVLFDILAVFVQGRGADAVQLAPCQHGL